LKTNYDLIFWRSNQASAYGQKPDTVAVICKNDYDELQREIWGSSIHHEQRGLDIVNNQYLLVAHYQEKVVGFCSLENGNYIDLMYVHKDYQRQGIAQKLYSEIENQATKLGQTELTSDVSITALPFFEKAGFRILSDQIVVKNGTEFRNFKMTKRIQ
jgi:putative acetyltransferase